VLDVHSMSKVTILTLNYRMSNYVFTAEEAAHYGKLVYDLVAGGDLKVKIYNEYPFTVEGVRQAQSDLTAPGGKTVGKLVIKV